MERKIDRKSIYIKHKRKKNVILFLMIIPAVLMLGSFLALYRFEIIKRMHLATVYIPLMIGYLVLVFLLAPKLFYNKMYSDYSRILINEPKLLTCNKQVYTTSWIDNLKKDGYELIQEDLRHVLLCRYYKKLPNVLNTNSTLVFLVIAKNKEFDFYSDEVDHGIQSYYMKYKDYEKVTKRITLQFKKYDMIDDKARQEVETAILYDAGKQTLVNLTFIYDNQDKILSLDSGNWYPNRYVYYAFKESKRICDIKE